jgi:putative oxidoreductase
MKKFTSLFIFILSTVLGAFFIYKGLNKHFLSPCKVFDATSTIPLAYQQVITGMCESGMLKVVGFFQILSGLLLVIPKTRIVGAMMLLPIIFNIFILHLFIDNRPEELVETGIPLLATLVILFFYYPKWKVLFRGY